MTLKNLSERDCPWPWGLLSGVVAVLICITAIYACDHDSDLTSKTEPEKKSQPNVLLIVADDPAESNDLSSKHPDIVEQLAQGWNQYARENGVILPEREIFYIKPPMSAY